jgi:predicted phosphodiesterase
MCDYCSHVKEVKIFRTPKEYGQTIEYIKGLIEKEKFIFVEGNCDIEEHKKNGCWVDDIIYHVIKCPKCDQIFSCAVNTYRGDGSFKKGI